MTHVRREDGLTLIEVMLAVFVLAVAVLAIAAVATTSLASLRQSRDREAATNAASATIEQVRARDWSDIVLDPADPGVAALGGCFEGEPVVANAGPTDPVPFETTVGRITVRTYITWEQSGGTDADCTGADDAERVAKRVTTVATWTDGGVVRTVRETTIVAQAARGLPVPDFKLSPATGALTFTENDVADGVEKCVRHSLRNLGATDRYDWEIALVSGDIGPPLKVSGSEFQSTNGNWTIRAYLGYPPSGTASPPPDAELMTDLDGNGRPEAETPVPENDTADLWICYEPKEDGPKVGVQFTTEVTVHSRFAPARTESVTHDVRVADVGLALYLFDPDDTQDHERGTTRGSKLTISPYLMGPEQAAQPEILGTALHDWDTNLDPDRKPGVRLVRGGDAARDLIWHEQFTTTTTLQRRATLVLWVATTASLTDPSAAPAVTQVLDISTVRLHSNEKNVLQSLASRTVSYVQGSSSAGSSDVTVRYDPTTGWTELTIPLDFGTTPTFDTNQFLELRVHCGAASAADCHVAYDHRTFASRLVVEVR